MDELGRWMGMNLVGKGNLKVSLHSTLCRTENMSGKIVEGGPVEIMEWEG